MRNRPSLRSSAALGWVPIRALSLVLALSMASGLTACNIVRGVTSGAIHSVADPMDPASSFNRTQARYTALMKWGQIQEAVEFVEPEIRGEFEALAAELSEVRIVDYSVRAVEFSQARTRATATVRLQAYWLSEPYPRDVEVTQHWRRDALSGRWLVTPDIERIRQAIRTGA